MKKHLIVGAALLALVLILPAAASAQDGTWTFKLATNQSQATKKIHAGIEDAISEMNFVIRPVGRSRLKGTNKPCKKLSFEIQGEKISIQCDSDKKFTTKSDGTIKRNVLGSDGESRYDLSQEVKSKGDKTVITQIFRAEDGRRTTVYVYDPSEKSMTMRVKVESPKLEPKSLRYKLPYKEI